MTQRDKRRVVGLPVSIGQIVAINLLLFLLPAWISRARAEGGSANTPQAPTVTAKAAEIAYYTCSMHPSVRASAPGTCPICSMTLQPVTVERNNFV